MEIKRNINQSEIRLLNGIELFIMSYAILTITCLFVFLSFSFINLNRLRENADFCLDTEGKIRLKDFLDTDEFASWDAYCNHMSRNGVWGDHLTLIAMANALDRNIFVVSSLETTEGSSGVTCIESKASDSQAAAKPAILLSHWHELHYNALVRDEKLF